MLGRAGTLRHVSETAILVAKPLYDIQTDFTDDQGIGYTMRNSRFKADKLGASVPRQSATVLLIGFFVAFLVASYEILIYGLSQHNTLQTIALAGTIGMGAFVAGGAIGFLFALPRSVTVAVPAAGGGHSRELRGVTVRPNTNLEEVSDWIVKIIIGLTLTQLGKIPSSAARLFALLGRSLGGSPQDTAFIGSIVIFGSIAGFLLGWLSTRMFIGRWMAASDLPLEAAASEAASRGDKQMESAIARARTERNAGGDPSGQEVQDIPKRINPGL